MNSLYTYRSLKFIVLLCFLKLNVFIENAILESI